MRASCVVALLGLLVACGSSGGTPDSGAPTDSSTPETSSGLCSFSPSNIDLSKIDFTNVEDVVISHDQTIETDLGGLLTGGSGNYTYQEISSSERAEARRAFAVKSFTVPSGVNVTVLGADALVIVALGDITDRRKRIRQLARRTRFAQRTGRRGRRECQFRRKWERWRRSGKRAHVWSRRGVLRRRR